MLRAGLLGLESLQGRSLNDEYITNKQQKIHSIKCTSVSLLGTPQKTTKNSTYELVNSRAGLFCPKANSVLSLKGQAHAKEGGNMHTKESAYQWEWLKKQT